MSKSNMMKNIYFTFSGAFGLYGISRQWRAEINQNIIIPNTNVTKVERLIFSITNGFLYSTPGLNLYYMYNLYDRIGIKYYNKKMNTLNDSYREFLGVCKKTF